jgi:hypothetical protein
MRTILDILRFPLNKMGLAHIGLFTLLVFVMMFVEIVLGKLMGRFIGYLAVYRLSGFGTNVHQYVGSH